MKNKQEIYLKKTKDLMFASLLKCNKYPFRGTELDGKTVYWIFEDNRHAADKLINDFINGSVKGNLKDFADAQQILRQTIFSQN